MKLIADNISKIYSNNVCGLKNFTMEIESKRVGILGEYGSGKSTLAQILATVTTPTSGNVYLNGKNISTSPDEARSLLGYLPQNFGVYSTLTAYEYLDYVAALKGKTKETREKKIEELLTLIKLPHVKDKMLGSMPPGMQQRVGIAQVFITDPQIIVIDELTDVLSSEERQDVLRTLNAYSQGKLLIIATETASDLEGIVDEIYILANGVLKVKTTPTDFIRTLHGKVWELKVPNSQLSAVRRKYFTVSAEHRRDGDTMRVISEVSPGEHAAPAQPNLNDAYQYLLHEWRGATQ